MGPYLLFLFGGAHFALAPHFVNGSHSQKTAAVLGVLFFEASNSMMFAFAQGRNGSFLKWWYPTTMGVPTKNDQLWGVKWGLPPFKETPKWQMEKVSCVKMSSVELTTNVDNAMKT